MSIISTVLISFGLYQRKSIHDILIEKRLRDNSESGINILLYNNNLEQQFGGYIQITKDARDSVLLEKRSWGLFSILLSVAFTREMEYETIYMSGWQMTSMEKNTCFYVESDKQNISITGESELTGNFYVPNKRITPSSIGGRNFKTSRKFNEIGFETKPIDLRFLNKITSEYDKCWHLEKDIKPLTDSLRNSFKSTTHHVYSRENIELNNCYFGGNILIESESKIVIKKRCTLENVILKAPTIIIEDHVTGNFQAFASDSVLVGEHVDLIYPSVLGLITKENSKIVPKMMIGNETRVSGIIFSTPTTEVHRKPTLQLENTTLVFGQIFWMGLILSKGSISGAVITEQIGSQIGSIFYSGVIADMNMECWGNNQSPVCIPFDYSSNRHQTIITSLKN